MENFGKRLKAEFIDGHSIFDWCFLAFGLLLQTFAIWYGYHTGTPDNVASIISAITGIISVVLCAQRKISFYLFGYIQLLTYTFGVAVPNHLYGEIGENIFYFITMVIGTVIWFKNYDETKVTAKRLSFLGNYFYYAVMVIGTVLLGITLSLTNDPVPWFDSITTVPAFLAQILLMLGYREQWVGWIIEDITSIIMFSILGNWVIVAQYVFWTINCIYGYIKWSQD